MGGVHKADDEFLHSGRFIVRQTLANHRRRANERRLTEFFEVAPLNWSQFRNGRLLSVGIGTIVDEDGTPDSLVIAAQLLTVLLEDGELVLDGRDITTNIACVAVLGNQPEGHLFPATPDQ